MIRTKFLVSYENFYQDNLVPDWDNVKTTISNRRAAQIWRRYQEWLQTKSKEE